MKHGIDVSMFINVKDVTAYKPDFVMIRSGEGGMRDAKTEYYAAQCRKNNIPYGYYHVLRLNNYTLMENVKSIKDAISKSGRPSMGVWVDVETSDAYDNYYINLLCSQIEEMGLYAGVYAGVNQLRSGKVNAPNYDKWVAFYGLDTGNLDDFSDEDKSIICNLGSLWQYHGSNSEPDLDVCFVDDLTIYSGKQTNDDAKNEIKAEIINIQTKLKALVEALNKIYKEIEKL